MILKYRFKALVLYWSISILHYFTNITNTLIIGSSQEQPVPKGSSNIIKY